MPIDTSSYYPEVPSDKESGNSYCLNDRRGSLFGDDHEGARTELPAPPKAPENTDRRQKDDLRTDGDRLADGVAHFLSWALVPLLMPVYGLILAFSLSILDVAPLGMRVAFTLIVAGIDVLVPMVLILVLKRMGAINDIGLNGRKERVVPYIITIVCYAATAWFMHYKGAPMWLSMFFAGGALAGVINMTVNFRWKISAHCAGIAGIVALLIRIEKDGSPEPGLFFWLILAICLAGLLGSARVWLGRHTVWQVIAGYAVGFCCVFFLTMIRG